MTIRQAEAEWRGAVKDGTGQMRLGGGAFEGAYSFRSRFETGPGTNPEELIAAAHAGCFSMALSFVLGNEGITPARIRTLAKVHLGATDAGPTITRIDLETEAESPGLDALRFQRCAETAKAICLVSRALAGVAKITLEARLVDLNQTP